MFSFTDEGFIDPLFIPPNPKILSATHPSSLFVEIGEDSAVDL